ncbi:MAG: Gfo/Idh/MocA family oxidoreductase [Clostridia bacterium]|nr:Gfo/Idh/MocA family oxidoreductase [Clostridia bacterium]
MKTVRIGIIGIGNIGSAHAAGIYRGDVPGLTLTALCDRDDNRAEELRRDFPDIPVFADAEEMMDAGLVDAVIISVPHYDHPPLAMLAFSKGLHVLTEKPAGVYCAKVREMVAAAKESGKVFAIMFNQRTNKLFAKARDIVQSGELGELKRSVWIITNWYRKQSYYDSGSWRATWSGEGGGVLMNQAPHNLDLWQWICGMPVELRADCGVATAHDIEVEDEATIFARYANGATGTFITTTGDYPGTNRLEITGTLGKLVIENKKMVWQKFSMSEREYCYSPDDVKMETETVEIEDEKYNGHHRVLANFADAILNGTPLVARGEEGLSELTLCNAAYLSAWTGKTVTLPMDDDLYYEELKKKIAGSRGTRENAKTAHTESGKYNDRWNTNW